MWRRVCHGLFVGRAYRLFEAFEELDKLLELVVGVKFKGDGAFAIGLTGEFDGGREELGEIFGKFSICLWDTPFLYKPRFDLIFFITSQTVVSVI